MTAPDSGSPGFLGLPGLPGLRDLAAVLGMLAALPAQVTGREGKAIRDHVARLGEILGADGPEPELRARAAAELEQLVTAITRLAGRTPPGKRAPGPAGGLDLAQLAGGLRTFAEFLRAPTGANQAEVEHMVASLQGSAVPRPVPLDQLDIRGTVEELAVESARRHGLAGVEARRAVERMKREMTTLVRQLELRAQQEASRARTAADMERLLGNVVQTGTALGQALAPECAPILEAFRRVDLLHMAEGLRVFGEWLSTPATDPAAHVAVLRARLTEALGPPTTGDPARSEAERRADFEREIQVAVDQIFRSSGRGPEPAP
jgi:hypothetical protein